jgi:hypothetical protein
LRVAGVWRVAVAVSWCWRFLCLDRTPDISHCFVKRRCALSNHLPGGDDHGDGRPLHPGKLSTYTTHPMTAQSMLPMDAAPGRGHGLIVKGVGRAMPRTAGG